jgi:hypothetical protein
MLHPTAAHNQYASSGHSISESMLAGYTDPPERSLRMGYYRTDDITPEVIRTHSGYRQPSYHNQYRPSFQDRSYPDDFRWNSTTGSSISSFRPDTPSDSRSYTSYGRHRGHDADEYYESDEESDSSSPQSYHHHNTGAYHYHNDRDYQYGGHHLAGYGQHHPGYEPNISYNRRYPDHDSEGYGSEYEEYDLDGGERAGYSHDNVNYHDDIPVASFDHLHLDDGPYHHGYGSGGSDYSHPQHHDDDDYPSDSEYYDSDNPGSSDYSD